MTYAKNNKMNKKGKIIEEEVLKLIIAVISIIVLLYLGASLYGIFTAKQRIEQAKSSLNDIKLILENLKDGESKNYVLIAPSKSYVISFSDGTGKVGCLNGKPCLCICSLERAIFEKIKEPIKVKDCSKDVLYCSQTERTLTSVNSQGIIEELPVELSFRKQGVLYYNVEVKK